MSSSIRFLRRFQPRFLLLPLLAIAIAAGLVYKSGPLGRVAHASPNAAFTPGNLVVYRVGDGGAALGAPATAVFLDEYTTAGALVQSIPLPTATVGSNRRLTASGNATSEGFLTRSVDGSYLIVSGYDAAPGTASITTSTSAAVNRVIGRVTAAGSVDTTTALTDAISGGNPRGATSTNGTDLWLSGTSSGGGIRYASFGATTSTALTTGGVTNLRATNIFGGQLYVTSASGTTRLVAVGTGTPTTNPQTLNNIPGLDSTTITGPYAFFFADLNAGVAGNDTLYVADEGGNLIRKFSLVGGTWVANGSIAAATVRGLTASVSGSNVTLFTQANGTTLATLTDTSGYNVAITGTLTTIATAGLNTAFRGVAFAPAAATPTLNIGDVTQVETNAGTTTFSFTVSLTAPAPAGGVTFSVDTADGTAQDDNPATEDNDYVPIVGGSGSITSGNTSTTVSVTVNGDATTEPDETFFVNLTNVVGATSGDLQGLGTITNDDNVTPTINISDVTMAEGNAGTTNFTFNVTLTSAALAGGVTFDIATQDGTAQDDNPATEDNDYVPQSLTGQTITVGNTGPYMFTVAVNGDPTTEPNETFFVNVTNISGATPGDVQGLGTITNDDVSITPIHTIQGNGATSPFAGNVVTTSGVVTLLKSNGFFLQEPDASVDADPNTSEGIFVFTSSAPTVLLGNAVTATGTVIEFGTGGTITELGSVSSVVVNSTGNPLPAAIPLTPTILDPTALPSQPQLEKFECMRMTGDLRTVAPNDDFFDVDTVLSSVARPIREIGMEISATIPPDPTSGLPDVNIPRWDENPERLSVDTNGRAGSTGLGITSNVALGIVTGVLDFAFAEYHLIPDADPTGFVNMTFVPVPVPLATEFTVACFNIENFNNGATQRQKAARAIRQVMRYPDIIGHEEIGSLAALQALRDQVNNDAVGVGDPNPLYEAYLIPGSGSQHVGFLVKTARVSVTSVTQEPAGTYLDPISGTPALLHDRPPLVLRGTVDPTGPNPIPVIVVVNHPRSFIAIDEDPSPPGDGQRVRAKRKAQGESIAALLDNLQDNNPGTSVMTVGDFNAFQFNDGYTDPIATIKGTPTADDQIVVDASPDVVSPDFFNLTDTLPVSERYSFVFEGTPQALDHVIVNRNALARFTRYAIARFDADFPGLPAAAFASDASRPEAASDHDAPVAYFNLTTAPTAANGVVSGRITDNQGAPVAGTVMQLSGSQNRKTITDANGNYRFENVETNGFYTVKPSRAGFAFTPALRSFNQLGNSTQAEFSATRTAGENPLGTPEFFVRQHYLDFLGREPDEAGFNFWSDQILECGADAACTERRTINVSAAYFLSIESMQTGGFVDGLYRASFGQRPQFAQFMPDARAVAENVIVGTPGWAETLLNNKQAFLNGWVQRASFKAAYDGMNHSQYVEALIGHTGVSFSAGERESLVSSLNNQTATRAEVLRRIAENEQFASAKRNEMFVMMEYFGYLRRDPDEAGLNFWLQKLNQHNGNFEQADMVKSFIVSGEYRARFMQ